MNNAAIAPKGTSWEGIDNWRKVFDVNLFGCALNVFRLEGLLLTVYLARVQRSERTAHVRAQYASPRKPVRYHQHGVQARHHQPSVSHHVPLVRERIRTKMTR